MSRSDHPLTSPATEAQIVAAVDGTPRGHMEVHARVGMWSGRTVMKVLNDLAMRGIVERSIVPVGRFGKSVYRLRMKPL